MPTLTWIGKEKVINHHRDVPFRILEHKYSFNETEGETAKPSNSGNKIIHGDNLEALKSLLPEYEGKVKCIYIDPPYNTGNENWVYNDNVNDPKIKKWLGQVVGKESDDLSRHDKWLCMMYPRLSLLYRLLTSNSFIFISIDENELNNLKLIMDEIFGHSNYVSSIANINNPKGRSDQKYISTAHEYLLIYKKGNPQFFGWYPEEKVTRRYRKFDEIAQKKYREIDLRKTGDNDLREDRQNLFYYFLYNQKSKDFYPTVDDYCPEGYIQIKPLREDGKEGNWRWELKTSLLNLKKLVPIKMPKRKIWSVFEIDYLEEDERVKPTSAWTKKEFNSERGTETFINLGFAKKDFPKPKPVGLIEHIILFAIKNNETILDSFAGSGSTAHAVLNLNKLDGANRKFILVEMEDYANSITAERAKRVINGYGEIKGTGGGFDYYELGKPLFVGENNEYLNEEVDTEKIREYIWYSETRKAFKRPEIKSDSHYFLGKKEGTAYYFIYEKESLTTLDYDTLSTIKTKAGQYVIYADNCLLPKDFMLKKNIVFKKIPRDVTRF